MLYAIMAKDAPDSGHTRAATRSRHLEYVQVLLRGGRLVFAGPHPAIDCSDPGPAGYTGSLIIAEFESLESAERWAADDPYRLAGVFSEVEVKPVLSTLP
jgi:uncharacterized protein